MDLKNVFVVLLLSFALSVTAYTADFGSVNFGMTKDEVKASEKGSTLVKETEDYLVYTEVSGENKVQSTYDFEDGKLIAALSIVATEHSDPIKYVNDFKMFDEKLKSANGEPEQQIVCFVDGQAGNEADLTDPSKLIAAIIAGKAVCSTNWRNDKFSVSHTLTDKIPTDEMDEEDKALIPAVKVAHLIYAEINRGDEHEENIDSEYDDDAEEGGYEDGDEESEDNEE